MTTEFILKWKSFESILLEMSVLYSLFRAKQGNMETITVAPAITNAVLQGITGVSS